MNDEIEVNTNVNIIPIEKIHPPKFDIRRWRKDYLACEDLEEYKELYGNTAGRNVAKLKEIEGSLKDEGLQSVLTVRPIENGEYEVVDGYTRLRFLEDYGVEKVPCSVLELSDTEAVRLNYRLNKADIDIRWWDTLRTLEIIRDIENCSQNEACRILRMDKSWGSKLFKIKEKCSEEEFIEYISKGLGSGKILDEIEGNDDDDLYTLFFNPTREIPKDEGNFLFVTKGQFTAFKNAKKKVSDPAKGVQPKELFSATIVALAEEHEDYVSSQIGIRDVVEEIKIVCERDERKIRELLEDKEILSKVVKLGLDTFLENLVKIVDKVTEKEFYDGMKEKLMEELEKQAKRNTRR